MASRSSEPLFFTDGDDVEWCVTERDARGDPGARGAYCLIFTCADVWRRVWDYPPDWRSLSVDALAALSLQR